MYRGARPVRLAAGGPDPGGHRRPLGPPGGHRPRPNGRRVQPAAAPRKWPPHCPGSRR